MAVHEARVELRPRVTAPAVGRRFLEALFDRVSGDTLEDARLLLTEVLTNAIRHARLRGDDVISVFVVPSGTHLVVEVSDPGVGFAGSVRASAGAGWGLFLLDRIAEDWGVRERPRGGTVVWFRLALDHGPVADPGSDR